MSEANSILQFSKSAHSFKNAQLTAYNTVARVKKIVHADEEVMNCSNSAAFVITVATEMFIQYMAERTHDVVKAEKKPRRNIQYRDVGMPPSLLIPSNLSALT